jgi:hypothetical protein
MGRRVKQSPEYFRQFSGLRVGIPWGLGGSSTGEWWELGGLSLFIVLQIFYNDYKYD